MISKRLWPWQFLSLIFQLPRGKRKECRFPSFNNLVLTPVTTEWAWLNCLSSLMLMKLPNNVVWDCAQTPAACDPDNNKSQEQQGTDSRSSSQAAKGWYFCLAVCHQYPRAGQKRDVRRSFSHCKKQCRTGSSCVLSSTAILDLLHLVSWIWWLIFRASLLGF